jgi:hypothetical protein
VAAPVGRCFRRLRWLAPRPGPGRVFLRLDLFLSFDLLLFRARVQQSRSDAPRGGNLPVGHPVQAAVWRDSSAYFSQFSKDFVVADIR